MASGKEIKSKIGSIKNTQKDHQRMEMVAASKMRKAQDRMAQAVHTLTNSQSDWSLLLTLNLEYTPVFRRT